VNTADSTDSAVAQLTSCMRRSTIRFGG